MNDDEVNENDLNYHFSYQMPKEYIDFLLYALGVPLNYYTTPIPPDNFGPKIQKEEMITELEFKKMLGEI